MADEVTKFKKDELSYKFLLAKQIDRVGGISSQIGYHGDSKGIDLYSAVYFLQTMLSPYFNDDKKQKKTTQVIQELLEVDKVEDVKDYPSVMERFKILMGFMARQNLLLETRGRGR